jgi:hypothetical protein
LCLHGTNSTIRSGNIHPDIKFRAYFEWMKDDKN